MERLAMPNGGAGKRLLSANALKGIAILAMLFQHTIYVLVPYEASPFLISAAGFVGFITAPIMFYFLVEGYRHTRNHNRYTLRLALLALASYLPFILAFTGELPGEDTYLMFNVGYTLLLAFLLLRVRHSALHPVLKWLLYLILFALSPFGDWGYDCLFIVLIFDYFHGDFSKQAFCYCTYVLADSVLSMSLYPVTYFTAEGVFNFSRVPYVMMMCGQFLPILLLSRYSGEKGRGGPVAKWGFYLFYPLHLLLLALIYRLGNG